MGQFLTGRCLSLTHQGILCLFVVLSYYPSLSVPFVFDDLANIVTNPAVHPESFKKLYLAFFSEIGSSRPLAMFSFAVNFLVGGLDVFGYHLVNIAIHLCNGLLLYHLIIQLGWLWQDRSEHLEITSVQLQRAAFWSALLWALNPVQTQAVTYVVQRMTAMATLFYLAALLFFVLWQRGKMKSYLVIALITICFLGGMACKQIVVTLPLALLLIGGLFSESEKRYLQRPLGYILLGLFFLIVVYYSHYIQVDWFSQSPGRNFSPVERVMSQWRILWHYLSLFIFPQTARLHLTYSPVVSTSLFSPWSTGAGLVAILFSLVIGWRLRRSYPFVSLAIFFYFLASALEASFLNIELAFIHRLYLPSVFLVSGLVLSLPDRVVRHGGPLLLLLAALWSWWTVERNVEWQDSEKLWAIEMERSLGTSRAMNNKVIAGFDKIGLEGGVVPYLDEALVDAVGKDRKYLLYNKAYGQFLAGEHQSSLDTLMVLMNEFGGFYYSPYLIGKNLLALVRVEEAQQLAEALLQEEGTGYWQGVLLMAGVYTARQEQEQAVEYLGKALAEAGSSQISVVIQLRDELARLYLSLGQIERAYQQYLEIVRLRPDILLAWKQIYRMLVAGGDVQNAAIVRRFLEAKGVELE